MKLETLGGDYTVCKIKSLKDADFGGGLVFLAKTAEEISLVCETRRAPENADAADTGWKALKVAGVLDFSEVGVIAKISGILAREKISVFVASTYDTDYIFLKARDYDKGVSALESEGYTVELR